MGLRNGRVCAPAADVTPVAAAARLATPNADGGPFDQPVSIGNAASLAHSPIDPSYSVSFS
jgi:hypothetical protein